MQSVAASLPVLPLLVPLLPQLVHATSPMAALYTASNPCTTPRCHRAVFLQGSKRTPSRIDGFDAAQRRRHTTASKLDSPHASTPLLLIAALLFELFEGDSITILHLAEEVKSVPAPSKTFRVMSSVPTAVMQVCLSFPRDSLTLATTSMLPS